MGNLKRFRFTFLNLMVHIKESEALRGTTEPPRGTMSEYDLTSMAPWGQIFTQEKHSQQPSGSWLYAFISSVFNTIRSFGHIYIHAVFSPPLQPSHFSGITKLGIIFPPALYLCCTTDRFVIVSTNLTSYAFLIFL